MRTKFLRIAMAALMLILGAAVASAQPGGQSGRSMDPEQIAKMRADRMKETLKLTDAQHTKLVTLFKAQQVEMQKKMQNGQGSFDRESMRAQMEKQNTEIKKILTDEQYKTWTEQQRQMMNRGGQGQGTPRPQGQGRPGRDW